MQIQIFNHHPIGFEPPKPPPPPPLPISGPLLNGERLIANKGIPNNQDTASRKQHQPLSAISIQDLNSVQVNL